MELRRFRRLNGISVAVMAQMLGCTPTLIRHYESGKRLPSLSRAARIEDLTEGMVACRDWSRPPFSAGDGA